MGAEKRSKHNVLPIWLTLARVLQNKSGNRMPRYTTVDGLTVFSAMELCFNNITHH